MTVFADNFRSRFFLHGVPDVLETLGPVVASAPRMSVCNRSDHFALPLSREMATICHGSPRCEDQL